MSVRQYDCCSSSARKSGSPKGGSRYSIARSASTICPVRKASATPIADLAPVSRTSIIVVVIVVAAVVVAALLVAVSAAVIATAFPDDAPGHDEAGECQQQ